MPAAPSASRAALERELAKAPSADGPAVTEAVVDPAHYSDPIYD